jgi:Tfp pilus assembly protein PilF
MSSNKTPTAGAALEFAIDAINRGDPVNGKAALTWALHREPNNALAWLWMACCVTDEQAKQECYRRADPRGWRRP